MSTARLRTPRLLLRPFAPGDAAKVLAYSSDPEFEVEGGRVAGAVHALLRDDWRG